MNKQIYCGTEQLRYIIPKSITNQLNLVNTKAQLFHDLKFKRLKQIYKHAKMCKGEKGKSRYLIRRLKKIKKGNFPFKV